MDEGDILACEKVDVGPRETALALETRLAALGARLLVATLARIDTVTRVKQDGACATLAPKVRKEEGRIDWTEPARAVDRRVLALGDRPGTYTMSGGKRINVLRGRALEAGSPAADGAGPDRRAGQDRPRGRLRRRDGLSRRGASAGRQRTHAGLRLLPRGKARPRRFLGLMIRERNATLRAGSCGGRPACRPGTPRSGRGARRPFRSGRCSR